jgi:5-formyltetrahydrofolate cyclo-ligase
VTPTLQDEKRRLREQVIAHRARLTPAERDDASRRIADRVAALDAFAAARTVALYAPIGAEVDTAEIARRAHADRKALAWPRLPSGRLALEFAACDPDRLVAGPHRTREPPPGAPALPPEGIDLVLVPGVAFDAAGQRLGRGRGHYDATLAAMPRRTARVGLCFEVQLVSRLPSEPHDARLDAIVTELRVLVPSP